MKTWLCCFSFFLFFILGAGLGCYGVGRLFFPETNLEEISEVEEKSAPYQGKMWRKRVVIQYAFYYTVVLLFLGRQKKPVWLWISWLIYGFLLGIYGAGLACVYGNPGGRLLVIPSMVTGGLISLITGVFYHKWKKRTRYEYYGRKKLRMWWEIFRIQILPYGSFGAALFLCWLLDQEVLGRLRWKWMIDIILLIFHI